MLPLRIAVAAGCLNEPVRRSLTIAQEIGAQGIQFDARRELIPSELSQTGRRQFLHQLDELGLADNTVVVSFTRVEPKDDIQRDWLLVQFLGQSSFVRCMICCVNAKDYEECGNRDWGPISHSRLFPSLNAVKIAG